MDTVNRISVIVWPSTENGRVDTTVRADRILFGISHRFGEKKTDSSP